MASLEETEKALQQTEQRLSGYTKDLPSQIETQVQKAWTPSLKEATKEVSRMQKQFLPKFFATPFTGLAGGTSSADFSPQMKLKAMGTAIGDLGGELNAATRLADYLGGQMQDMYQKSLSAAQFGYQSLADQYNREFQRYQMAFQAAEAEKDRALRRASMAAAQQAYTPLNFEGLEQEGKKGKGAKQIAKQKPFGLKTFRERLQGVNKKMGWEGAFNLLNRLAGEVRTSPHDYKTRGDIFRRYWGKIPQQYQSDQMKTLMQSITSGQFLR